MLSELQSKQAIVQIST